MARRILVPFDLPDPRPLTRRLIESLSGMDVLLLGHYGLPEQTPPDAGRAQFEEDAQRELEALAADFEEAGVEVTTRLMFGGDFEKAIDQVADEGECDAVLDPAPTQGIERVFVPILDAANLNRLAGVCWALVETTGAAVTLAHVLAEDEDRDQAERTLDEAREALVGRGMAADSIETTIIESEERDEAMLDATEDHDAVVMNDPDPTVAEWVLGTLPERMARRTVSPVIIVRRQD